MKDEKFTKSNKTNNNFTRLSFKAAKGIIKPLSDSIKYINNARLKYIYQEPPVRKW